MKNKNIFSILLSFMIIINSSISVFAVDLDQQINEITSSYKDKKISIYYKDLNSGYEYIYNGDYIYENASIKKVPLYLYIYTEIKNGGMDLDTILTYTSSDTYGGTGIIQGSKIGSKYSIEDLLTKSIIYSDNIAFKMLQRSVNANDYNSFIDTIGGRVNYYQYTVKNVAGYMNYLYNFINENDEYKEQIMYDFTNTIFNEKIPKGVPDDILVAHKIGFLDSSYHDAAIVFDENPYILIIMTENGNVGNIDKLFQDISSKIYNIHTVLHKNIKNSYYVNDELINTEEIIFEEDETFIDLCKFIEISNIEFIFNEDIIKFQIDNFDLSNAKAYISEKAIINDYGFNKNIKFVVEDNSLVQKTTYSN